jgi:uroporphyrinogen decarboxylase
MKQDRMTAAERIDALLKGKPVDRVGFFSFILGFCGKNVGLPVATIYSDPEKSFWAQNCTRKQYGYDSDPFYGYASYGGAEFGGEIKLPLGEYEQAPSHVRFAVESEQDLEQLALPDVETAGMLPLAMRFSHEQNEQGLFPSVVIGGPFTIAGNICPVDKLCRWLIKRPEVGYRILRLAADHILDVTRYWIETFEVEVHCKILGMGIRYILCHICGEQNLNLPYWAQVPMGNPGIVSVGREVDIDTAVKFFGKECIIAGNIEPSIIQTGTPQAIYELCRQAIEKGKRAPRGYLLMQGCEVPVNTPPYNLYSMRMAIEDFGRFE